MKTTVKRIGVVLLYGAWVPLAALAAPPNDSFSSPATVTNFPSSVSGNNEDATLEPGEPVPESVAEASVWFVWEASLTGAVRMDTTNSEIDTLIAVWTGNEMTNLTLLAENDDSDNGEVQSTVFLNVTAGTTYRIAVYGYEDARGPITLNISEDPTSKISGTVTGPDSTTPLQNIDITAYRLTDASYWAPVKTVSTDFNGNYTIGGLDADTYRIEFTDPNGDYPTEVYNDKSDILAGDDIIVPSGTAINNINASLASITPPEPSRIVALQRVGGHDWEIQYVGTAGKEYILQEGPSLMGSLEDVGTSFLCQPGTNTISRQSSAPALFWRLREIPATVQTPERTIDARPSR